MFQSPAVTLPVKLPGYAHKLRILSYLNLFLPLESLDSVAYKRPTQKRAELFRCLESGSLTGATGRKNDRHREVHAALRRLVVALPGLVGWENPWMSGPARVTVITLRVNAVNLHQFAVERSRQVIPKNCSFPAKWAGWEEEALSTEIWENSAVEVEQLNGELPANDFKIKSLVVFFNLTTN